MSTSIAKLTAGPVREASDVSLATRARAYFASDQARTIQTGLGLVWLLDGALQFQSFMYSKGFIQLITDQTAGQPRWVADSINWGAHIAAGNLSLWNTLFALTQVAIGLGLLYRPTVRPALAVSFAWAVVVWWFGEAFGMLLMNMAQPLTGAPGGVLLYALVGLLVWPSGRPGGLLGARGAKTMWAVLWLVMAWLWLLAPSSSANATHDALASVDTGMGWLNALQNNVAVAAKGNGLVIALVLSALSAAIGIAVAADWRPRLFLGIAIGLSLVYWILPQGLGGIFAGGATDPNAGPLFVLLACAMYPLTASGEFRSGSDMTARHLRPVAPSHSND
jgi:hypothetical protein